MPIDISIKKKNSKTEGFVIDIIDENIQDYSNEPAFIKQNEKARASLKKHGLPKELRDKLIQK